MMPATTGTASEKYRGRVEFGKRKVEAGPDQQTAAAVSSLFSFLTVGRLEGLQMRSG
jgi:hypothetical protein